MNRLLFVVLLGASRALRVSRQPISSAIPTWKRRLPNALTCARLGAVPVVAAALCTPSGAPGIACGAFALTASLQASVTDWFDGALARCIVSADAAGWNVGAQAMARRVGLWQILRSSRRQAPRHEHARPPDAAHRHGPKRCDPERRRPEMDRHARSRRQSSSCAKLRALGRSGVVQVNWAGKLKTATQMVALAALLASHHRRASTLHAAGLALLWTSAALALQSGAMLFSAAWPGLFPSREDEAGP